MSIPRHYQHPICAALLLVKAGEYPELRIKAHAGRILLAYLQVRVAEMVNSYRGEVPSKLLLVSAALTELSQWMLKLELYPRFLSTDAANDLWGTHSRTHVCNHVPVRIDAHTPITVHARCAACMGLLRFLDRYSLLASQARHAGELQSPLKPKFHVPWPSFLSVLRARTGS